MVLREVPTENITRPLGRNEVIGLLFRLTIFGAVTYFTIKWMVDAIDPTRKQKVEAKKQVEGRSFGVTVFRRRCRTSRTDVCPTGRETDGQDRREERETVGVRDEHRRSPGGPAQHAGKFSSRHAAGELAPALTFDPPADHLEGHRRSGRGDHRTEGDGDLTCSKETPVPGVQAPAAPQRSEVTFLVCVSSLDPNHLVFAVAGVLLYGPPGCGKTLIAKATAKEAGFRFINLQPSTLTDKWYGESQKLAAAVFSLAVKLQPSIIFIDEIDSFLRSRSSSDHEATAMMKAQFMSLWDGLDTDHYCQVIIMGATNRPQDLDSAILRRMPTRFHINQPSAKQREKILELILQDEGVDSQVNLLDVAKETDGFSGSDLREMCRDAALLCVRDFVHNQSESEDYIRPICTPLWTEVT
uniref:Outer mitochondrial transmembrane helix translocase n=1 Tax=Oryzias latipes TaxID=8090 RepID=A0A3B3IDC2_ORYLA